MAHSHILNHREWSLTRLNGIARAKPRERTTERDVERAVEYAKNCGATDEQILAAIVSPTRLRF